MQTRTTLTLCIAVLVFAVPGALAQGRVTVDPNSKTAPVEAPANTDSDAGLAQKVTYSSGSTRLHYATEELSKISGVGVYCGQNNSNWQVRDIPLVVCVKDIPLGKTLRAMADATHCGVSSAQTKGGQGYRIYRRPKEEQEINSLFEDRHAARVAMATWTWQAAIAYGKSSPQPGIPQATWVLSKIISNLGTDSTERMLAGEKFTFWGNNPAYASDISELCTLNCQEIRNRNYLDPVTHQPLPKDTSPIPTPTPAELARACLSIKLFDTGTSGETHVDTNIAPVPCSKMPGICSHYLDDLEMGMQKLQGAKLPPMPQPVTIPTRKEDMTNSRMHYLEPRGLLTKQYPALEVPIDINPPAEGAPATFADVITKAAAASGFNIVCEDFRSHTMTDGRLSAARYAKGTTLAQTLAQVTDYAWFFDESSKLIVGWADDKWGLSARWREHHRNLVSEAYLNGLKAKLNSGGMDIEDVMTFANLPEGAFKEWIGDNRDLSILSRSRPFLDLALWQLYDFLSPEDKAQAKTASGVSLSKYDVNKIKQFCADERKQNSIRYSVTFANWEQKMKWEDEVKRKEELISDSSLISTMVLRVKQKPAATRFATNAKGMQEKSAVPNGLDLHTYDMELSYTKDGQTSTVLARPPLVVYPIYSTAREAELLKTAGQAGK